MQNKIPLVSVVIPMFNSAKFIPQTLESLLYQTMTNFEVIVADDCSTDNSVAVVESYAKKFGGRLKLVKLRQNTGTPGLPRNVAINMACGKYIAFLDSDDLFTKTALEELTTLAEKFQAEVVRLHKNFVLWGGKETPVDAPEFTDFAALTNPKNFSLHIYRQDNSTEPTLAPEDIGERVRAWVNSPTFDFWSTWLYFYRRDFLIANQIQFPPMPSGEDAPFAFEAMCLAKRYLDAPNTVYIVRPRLGSIMRSRADTEKFFQKRVSAIKEGFNQFERIMSKINFFSGRADYRYAVLKWFANVRISVTALVYTQMPVLKLDEIVRREFPDDAAFCAYLFDTVNIYRLQLMKLQRELAALKK